MHPFKGTSNSTNRQIDCPEDLVYSTNQQRDCKEEHGQRFPGRTGQDHDMT